MASRCLGAEINKADDYGRTPIHVAASADYPEMVRFLIDNGADFQITTKGELQTPLHFAARNEASQCVKILLAYGANLEVRDYKQRTPLQVRRAILRTTLYFFLVGGGGEGGWGAKGTFHRIIVSARLRVNVSF